MVYVWSHDQVGSGDDIGTEPAEERRCPQGPDDLCREEAEGRRGPYPREGVSVKATSPVPVANALIRSAKPSESDRRSPAIPEPITAATRKAVAANSDASRLLSDASIPNRRSHRKGTHSTGIRRQPCSPPFAMNSISQGHPSDGFSRHASTGYCWIIRASSCLTRCSRASSESTSAIRP